MHDPGQGTPGKDATTDVTADAIEPRWDTESVFDETQSTHLWIVNRAAELAGTYGGLGTTLVKLVKPGRGRIGDPFHDGLCQGLYDADWKAPYNDPDDGMTTYKSHFYDPITGKNWKDETSPTALTRCVGLFEESLRAYLKQNMGGAGYYLGLSLHYFTDMTQPMHSTNFTWQKSSPVRGYHTAFETYAMEIQATVTPPGSYTPSTLGTTPAAHLKAAALQSRQSLRGICPQSIEGQYYGMTDDLRRMIRQGLPSILRTAITVTAQYLIAWVTEVSSGWHNEDGVARLGAGVSTIGDQAWAAVIRPDGHLAVNFPLNANTGRGWADCQTPAGTSIAQPLGLTGFGGMAYAYVLGADGNLWLNASHGSSGTWTNCGTPSRGGAPEDASPDVPAGDGAGIRPAEIAAGDTAEPRAPLGIRMGLGVSVSATTPVAYVLTGGGDVYYHTTLLAKKWTTIGLPTPSAPVIKAAGTANYPDNPFVAVITGDGRLRVHGLGPGNLRQWMNAGTPPGAAIAGTVGMAAAEHGPHVAVIGSDGNLWVASLRGHDVTWRWQNHFRPSYGTNLGGPLSAGVGAAVSGTMEQVIYFVTADTGDLWLCWLDEELNSPQWEPAGTPDATVTVAGAVGAAWGKYQPQAYVIGTDGSLWNHSGTGTPVASAS
jgi:hypothetical protein